jgi:hypothetical protein
LSKWKLSNFQFHGNPCQNIVPFQDPTFDSPNGGDYVETTKDASCSSQDLEHVFFVNLPKRSTNSEKWKHGSMTFHFNESKQHLQYFLVPNMSLRSINLGTEIHPSKG